MHDEELRVQRLVAEFRRLRDGSRACAAAIDRRIEDPAGSDPSGRTAWCMSFEGIHASAQESRVSEEARSRRALIAHFIALPVVLAGCAWLVFIVWSIT